MGQGVSRLDAIRQIGVVEQTYYLWRWTGRRSTEGTEAAPEGERLLRELQWQIQRRTAQRRDLLQPTGSTDHHRRMEKTLQHKETTQCIGLPPTSS